MANKVESDLVHNFKMVVGGTAVIGGAVLNALLVRPLKSFFSMATGGPKKTSRGFVADIMPLEHE